MAFTKHVHSRDERDPSVISKISPYVRFQKKGEVPIFLQEGKFYFEDGKHINQPHKNCKWAYEQAENLSDKAKKEVGFTRPPKKRGRPFNDPKKQHDAVFGKENQSEVTIYGDNRSDGGVGSEGAA